MPTQQPDAGEPLFRWDWVGNHLDDVLRRTLEHLELTVIAVSVGLVERKNGTIIIKLKNM